MSVLLLLYAGLALRSATGGSDRQLTSSVSLKEHELEEEGSERCRPHPGAAGPRSSSLQQPGPAREASRGQHICKAKKLPGPLLALPCRALIRGPRSTQESTAAGAQQRVKTLEGSRDLMTPVSVISGDQTMYCRA